MAGSKNFAKLAQKLIEEKDRAGAKDRQQRWHAKQLMQQITVEDIQEQAKKISSLDENNKSKDQMGLEELPCACGASCFFSVVLANLSRVLWMAFEEYELLHAFYSDLFTETQRPSENRKVEIYWKTFVLNPIPTGPHNHAEQLLHKCQKERDTHLSEKAMLPVDPVAPLRRGLLSSLLDPFSCVKCRCIHCMYLDAVMDYRVALFGLLTEYCRLFEDYAQLFWATEVQLNPSEREVTLKASEMDVKMLDLTLKELYSATSFDGETTNVMRSLRFLRNLIYR